MVGLRHLAEELEVRRAVLHMPHNIVLRQLLLLVLRGCVCFCRCARSVFVRQWVGG